MKHGIIRWVQKGFPTIGDTGVLPKEGDCCSKPGCCQILIQHDNRRM
ncbi:MAG: hypothetical protein IPN86_17830 [Saprospiraceae bacterium]|nr:hypothetical protein [Saprospiraceae bacterium]